ncbi:MAG: xanthine dehydrogenase family protein subunit M, partial [Hyphomicrobiaceae bacterium]
MRPFDLSRVQTPRDAIAAANSATEFIAGGTTLVDLMRLDVLRPTKVVDINPLEQDPRLGGIEVGDGEIRLGALVRMSKAASDERLAKAMPALVQSLDLAASQQLRNMASLGGNVLQRTRCPYFRDTSWAACNKREPGSGCAALGGFNRLHAVLGASDACIATYPGDWAQALVALEAMIEIAGPRGERTIPFAELHRMPASTPQIETVLEPGDLIVGFRIPRNDRARRSVYVKVRDRASY